MAEEKFEESKVLAETAMHNLLDNDAEQLLQLSAFIEAELGFHQQSVDILQALMDSLKRKCSDAASRPRKEYVLKKPMAATRMNSDNFDGSSLSVNRSTLASSRGGSENPCCEALYDFEAENEGELGFKEGDIIHLLNRIDENWLEGSINGQTGYFPVNYVKVLVDLPPE